MNLIRTLLALFLLYPSIAFSQDEIAILSPHWEGIRREYEIGFKEWWRQKSHREVNVRWIDVGGTSDIVRYIKGGFKASPESIGVDLFFGGGVDPFRDLDRSQLFERVELPRELGFLPDREVGGVELRSVNYTWYSAMINSFGILYNKKVIDKLKLPTPLGWDEIASKEAFGWVGLADPRKSGSAHIIYELVLQAYGWERGWKVLYGLAANARGFSGTAAQVPKEVAVGEVAYGLCIDSYAQEAIRSAGSENMSFVFPKNLSAYIGDSIAVLKGAPHREIAHAFMFYVLSTEGQRLLVRKAGSPGGPKEMTLGRISVRPDVYGGNDPYLAVLENPFQESREFSYSSTVGGERWAIINDLVGTFLIDSQDSLIALRKEELFEQRELISKLPPPESENEIGRLVKSRKWEDPHFRNETIARWSEEAGQRFTTEGEGISFFALLPTLLIGFLLAYLLWFGWKRQ